MCDGAAATGLSNLLSFLPVNIQDMTHCGPNDVEVFDGQESISDDEMLSFVRGYDETVDRQDRGGYLFITCSTLQQLEFNRSQRCRGRMRYGHDEPIFVT